jgi:hypothetical protein
MQTFQLFVVLFPGEGDACQKVSVQMAQFSGLPSHAEFSSYGWT